MTLLSVVKDVCMVIGVTAPSSVFSGIAGNRTMQEILALANEMAQRIANDRREWSLLKKTQTFEGNGVKTAFDMPANYNRMLLTSNVWRSTSDMTPMRFVPDTDEWVFRRGRQEYYDARGEWTLMGGQMHIAPALAEGQTASFAYLDKNAVALASGGFSDSFLADLDTFPISERLLKLGMIWQWKANKGSSYAEDMGTYNDAMDSLAGRDSPAPIIIGRMPMSSTITGYPWTIPT